MLYCFTDETYENGYIEYDRKFAKKNNCYCFYDVKNDKFYDENHNELNIAGLEIFVRSFLNHIDQTINSIINNGGIPLNSLEKTKETLNWNNYLTTERKIITTNGRELTNDLVKEYIDDLQINGEIFLKTINKDFNGLVDVEDFYNKDSALFKALELHQNTKFQITEPVNIIKDDFGQNEYRCFIVKNKLLNISRPLNKTYHQIPVEVFDKANEFIMTISYIEQLPNSYVLDLMIYEKNGQKIIDILEMNPIEMSGEYLYNSPFSKYCDDLLHNDVKNIPDHKKDIDNYSYTNNENLRPSTTDGLRNSFSYNFKNLAFYNNPDIQFSSLNFMTKSLDYRKLKKPIFNLNNMKKVTDGF